jgi:hypothetical protein
MSSKQECIPIIFSLEDFLVEVAPKGKRSKLEPFASEIARAIEKGLSYDQIVQWLARNDVIISKAAVNQWVHRRARAQVSRPSSDHAVEVTQTKRFSSDSNLAGTGSDRAPPSSPVPILRNTEVAATRCLGSEGDAQANPGEKQQTTGLRREAAIRGLRQATQKLLESEKGVDLSGYKPPVEI